MHLFQLRRFFIRYFLYFYCKSGGSKVISVGEVYTSDAEISIKSRQILISKNLYRFLSLFQIQ